MTGDTQDIARRSRPSLRSAAGRLLVALGRRPGDHDRDPCPAGRRRVGQREPCAVRRRRSRVHGCRGHHARTRRDRTAAPTSVGRAHVRVVPRRILAAVVNALLLFGLPRSSSSRRGGASRSRCRSKAASCSLSPWPGAIGNLVALRVLHRPQQRSLNMRGAYLEVLGDLLGSIAVIVAAAVIWGHGARQPPMPSRGAHRADDPAADLGAPSRRR